MKYSTRIVWQITDVIGEYIIVEKDSHASPACSGRSTVRRGRSIRIRAARPQCSTIRSSCGDRTPQDGRRGTWTARFTCAQCSIEPQGPKTLRRGRKEGAGVARFRRFRFGWVMEPKNSLAWSNEDARTARSGRSGRAVEKRLHGAVDGGAQAARRECSRISIEPQGLKTLRRGRKRVREPQGSRSLKPIGP
jgi:hypothetical protein